MKVIINTVTDDGMAKDLAAEYMRLFREYPASVSEHEIMSDAMRNLWGYHPDEEEVEEIEHMAWDMIDLMQRKEQLEIPIPSELFHRGFVDATSGNDIARLAINDKRGFAVWCAHPVARLRESGGARFQVMSVQDEEPTQEELFLTDSMDDLLSFVDGELIKCDQCPTVALYWQFNGGCCNKCGGAK